MNRKFIIISGIDGSGKTSVVVRLIERLNNQGVKTHYAWMRYHHILCKPVHGICRLIGLSRRYETSHGTVWRHEFYRSRVFCSLYIPLTFIDTWLGRLRLMHELRKLDVDVVICDRWILDILIDLAVKTRNVGLLDSKWYDRFHRLQPDQSVQFVIVRNRSAVLACRPENRDDPDFELRRQCYEKVSERCAVRMVDNNGTIDASAQTILDVTMNDNRARSSNS